MMHQASQGLASLGRNGDSMLVHMSPKEVAGLQGLAMAQGGSLTVNPDTGLPEAFSLRNLFTSLLPTAVGALVGGPLGAGAVGGLLGGAATGAAIAKSKGEDPLMGGLMGGLGGYGGAGIAEGLKAAGASSLTNAANPAVENIATNTAQTTLGNVGGTGEIGSSLLKSGVTPGAETTLSSQISPFTNNTLGSSLGVPPSSTGLAVPSGGYDAVANSFDGQMSQIGQGAKNLLGFGNAPGTQSAAYDAASKVTPNFGTKLALTGGQGVLGGLEPSDLYGDPIDTRDRNKYDPYARLNLNNDTGLRLLAEGGFVKDYALGGAVNTNPSVGGGLSDLYNRPEGATTQGLSNDGFGMGRLDRLASQESLNHAKTFGYAEGGDVGMNLDKLPTLNLDTGKASSMNEDPSTFNLFGLPMSLSMVQGYGGPQTNPFTGAPIDRPPMPFGLFGGGRNAAPEPKSYALNLNSGKQEPQYAGGGYLNGGGDGMSDSIPATIEGKQPARLADGEFVVPADVVSHLGNGSSKAGSKRLYAMLDKVRQARTGTKKQGKQIKADKYLPA